MTTNRLTGRSDPNAQRLMAALAPTASATPAPTATPAPRTSPYGLNYDPNYLPSTGTQNFSYTDAMNQGYSPAMSEAAARGQGIPQYTAAPSPTIEDPANLARREQQGNGMGLFAGGVAGMMGAAGLINALGGGAGAAGAAGGSSAGTAGTGAAAGTGATAGTAAGTAGTAAGTAGAIGAPAGIEGVTVLGSSGAGAGAGAAAGAGAGAVGGAASMWDSVNQGASNTSETNARNDQQLHDMQSPTTARDWSTILSRSARAAGLLNSSGLGGGGGGGDSSGPAGPGIHRNTPNPVVSPGTPLPTGAPVPTNPATAWNAQTFGGGGGAGFRPTAQQNLQPIALRPYAAQGNAPVGTDGYYV
jgi:hypothetical protein